jgi:hypothetical protein
MAIVEVASCRVPGCSSPPRSSRLELAFSPAAGIGIVFLKIRIVTHRDQARTTAQREGARLAIAGTTAMRVSYTLLAHQQRVREAHLPCYTPASYICSGTKKSALYSSILNLGERE